MIRISFIVVFTFMCSALASAQPELLRKKIEQMLSTKNAIVGVAIQGPGSKDTLSINGDKHFPMQSVFKFHIALAVLHEVDMGKLSLNKELPIDKSELMENTHSPLRDKYPDGNVKLPLSEVLHYTVSLSDNSGCDILLKLLRGPKVVDDYIHGLGIKNVSIVANEEEMHKSWDVQFKNWSTPRSAVELLKLFYKGGIQSKTSYDFLWNAMTETPTGRNRIRGQLPAETVVVHKTGTSGRTDEGIIAAVNDIGLVITPNGNHFAIAVFVSNSKEDDETNEKIIADISKAAYDYFMNVK